MADANALGQLEAIAQGGKSAGDAYKAAAGQMSSQRSAALSQALGRANAINAPAAFNSYAAPRITGAFDAGITKNNALSAADSAFNSARSGASNNLISGLRSLAPMLAQQEGAKYAQGGPEYNKAFSSAVSQITAPIRLQNEIGNYQKNARNNAADQAKTSAQQFFSKATDFNDPQINAQHALGRDLVNSNTGFAGALTDLQNISRAIQLGPSGTFQGSNGKSQSNKQNYQTAVQNLAKLGLSPADIQNVDQGAFVSLLRQYYGQPDVGSY